MKRKEKKKCEKVFEGSDSPAGGSSPAALTFHTALNSFLPLFLQNITHRNFTLARVPVSLSTPFFLLYIIILFPFVRKKEREKKKFFRSWEWNDRHTFNFLFTQLPLSSPPPPFTDLFSPPLLQGEREGRLSLPATSMAISSNSPG